MQPTLDTPPGATTELPVSGPRPAPIAASAASPTSATLATLSSAAALALAACGGHVDTPGPNGTSTVGGLAGANSGGAAASAARPSEVDAARFMAQATFGVRSEQEVAALVEQGLERWLAAQMNERAELHTSYIDWQRQRNGPQTYVTEDMAYEAMWRHWLHGQDQLRSRITFALSQIFVVSNVASDLRAYGMASYMDMLQAHAFGSYRDLLQAVTLHPTMGYFLNMRSSERSNATIGARPNENYAREVLQLLSIGLVELNNDGTPRRDAGGATMPTFNEAVVKGFAQAFTGWGFALSANFRSPDEGLDANWKTPMVPFESFHEPGPKLLLGGATIPGGTAAQDLAAALDNIAAHPNVGPFIGRQLIQRLVTSNPSAAYINRVANVFNDNGAGARGDLAAVVRAVLLDAEARDPSLGAAGRFGKQREPVLRLANLLRAMNVSNKTGRNAVHALDSGDDALGQSPLLAPSVFNFFSPNFRPAGPLAAAGLVAPEFQITTETAVVGSLNFLRRVIQEGGHGWAAGRLDFDWAPWVAVAADTAALLARLDLFFFHGQMSAGTRSRMAALVDSINPAQTQERVKAALTLTMVSPDHVIQT